MQRGQPGFGRFGDAIKLMDTVRNNGDSGINIDPNSDNARLFDNVVTSNTTDLVNDGSGNCGSGNTIGSHSGNPLSSC